MPFKPGVSGNPAARKPGSSNIRSFARGGGREAVEQLRKLITGTKYHPALKLRAIRELLDRAYGRPTECAAPFLKVNPKDAGVFDVEQSTVIIVPAQEKSGGSPVDTPVEPLELEDIEQELVEELAAEAAAQGEPLAAGRLDEPFAGLPGVPNETEIVPNGTAEAPPMAAPKPQPVIDGDVAIVEAGTGKIIYVRKPSQ